MSQRIFSTLNYNGNDSIKNILRKDINVINNVMLVKTFRIGTYFSTYPIKNPDNRILKLGSTSDAAFKYIPLIQQTQK